MFDDLTTFEEIAKKDYKFKVLPAFRADKVMNIDAKGYKDVLGLVEAKVGFAISNTHPRTGKGPGPVEIRGHSCHSRYSR